MPPPAPPVAAIDPAEREIDAHEAHASATVTALLLLLWGAVSVFIQPQRFHVVDITHTFVGSVALIFWLSTRHRPRARLAYAFCAAVILDTLFVLPWITAEWCAVGRPFEAVTVPHIAMLTVALVVPRSLVLRIVTMLLFLAEGLFVTFYAHHVGVAARLPVGEPFTTLIFVVPAVGLVLVRERRRWLARRHLRLRAETEALDRLSPLFSDVRARLTAQLRVVSAELDAVAASPVRGSIERSVGRLADVDARLAALVEPAPSEAPATADAAPTSGERAFMAADEQLGALSFAILTVLVALLWVPIAATELTTAFTASVVVGGVTASAVLWLLVMTRRAPSQRRSRAALLTLFVILLVAVSLNQRTFLVVQRPFTPFTGQKLLMVILGLTAASWSSLGLPLILVTAADALILYWVLGFGALKDRLSATEPWITLVFMAIGIVALLQRDQRRVASLALLRAEARASAMHRRAVMLLALRDQLNTPLQTLVLDATRLAMRDPGHDLSRVKAAIDRLVALSRELAQLDIPTESQLASVGPGDLHRLAG